MKLTIEDILRRLVNSVATQFGSEYVEFHNKSIARTSADIQAYVKQEMRKMVPEEKIDNKAYERSYRYELTGFNDCRSSILSAIDNYGKEDKQ
jgi:hypothetical protein